MLLSLCVVECCVPTALCVLNVRLLFSSPSYSLPLWYYRSKQLTVTFMTTMFVQLRGVMYLMVLLQCCVCVTQVLADRDDFLEAEKAVQKSVNHTEQFVPGVEACLHLWVTELPKCLQKCEEVKKIAPKVRSIVERIEKDPSARVGEDVGAKKEKIIQQDVSGPIVELVEQAKKLVPEAGNAARGCSGPVNKTKVRGRMCAVYADNLAPHVMRFPQSLQYYENEMSYADDVEKAREYLHSSYELYYMASNLTHNVSNQAGDIRRCGTFRDHDWRDVRDGVQKLVRLLTHHGGARLGEEEEAKWVEVSGPRDEENKTQVEQDMKDQAKFGARKVVVKNEDESGIGEGGVRHYGGGGGSPANLIRPREIQGDIKEFKGDLERAVKEVALEKKLAAERDKKEREEQESARRAREEEERARKVREVEEKKAREEKEKKAREEQEREAKEREQRAREEEKRRAAEKPRREEVKRVVEKKAKNAKKKGDGSHSPALVHSPLLLLLLSVLGCTLVC
ncbi:uncharacterized protein TM35_000801080 [Trypanosoma theileri]|uniref:Uncharacterized protein n=1 Tax=Trypanosoma theileri TaxID=67003 RepID=A0A1X0NF91_9TRYP|nr:uncharacterized protein TM35_000801080 [Trypanosoma theileri]ORC82970.1 hypothetical protein TM35_000801080 [Trypanosoma theileri]